MADLLKCRRIVLGPSSHEWTKVVQPKAIVMDDDDYEIHPLDRDYSLPSQPAKKRLAKLSQLHRIGFATFAAGFVTVVLAAIVLGAFPSGGWFETIGSFMHRLAMYFILIGGVLVLAAYQAPRRAAAAKKRERRELGRGRLELLELSTVENAPRVEEASIGQPSNRLGAVSLVIATGMIALTMASFYVVRFGINGRSSMTILITLSWLNFFGYPLSLFCSWRAVSQPGSDHLPARIAGTLAIAGHLMLILRGFYWSRASLMPIAFVIVVTCIASYIAKGQAFRQTYRGSGQLRQSELGILVTAIAVAWLLVGTVGLPLLHGNLSSIYAGSISQILLVLACAMAIVSYWQINRDPYYSGLGALLIVALPYLPIILLALTSTSAAMVLVLFVWCFVIGAVLIRPLRRAARS
jgi:hypothetical protein